jgi:hypothetical protein
MMYSASGFDAMILEDRLQFHPGGVQWKEFLNSYSGFTPVWKEYIKLPHVNPIRTLHCVLRNTNPQSPKLPTSEGFGAIKDLSAYCQLYGMSMEDLKGAYEAARMSSKLT